jgi:zinc D-Ala-D-Ala carboxypeptidase|tara:strand:+ start:4431 stop:4877 length:447 start_codon:yes stop_codon:yes gene_type:complete
MQLSNHFSLRELIKSQTAERMEISNYPTDAEIANLVLVCENILEPVREHYGVAITPSSGFRCIELNRQIGSKDTSQHTTGQAVDFEVMGNPNLDVALWVKDNCQFDQLILEFYKENDPHSGWIHCSYAEGNNRSQAKKFDGRSWETLG